MARPTVLQWMVARALCEGAPATKGRVAALMGVGASAVHARAATGGWNTLDWRKAKLQTLQRAIVASNTAENEPGTGAGPTGAAEAAGAGAEATAATGDGGPGGIDPPDREPDGAAVVASARRPLGKAAERPPGTDDPDPVAVLAGASAFVVRQVAALIERAERSGGRLDKKQIDGLSAFARMMEHWEALARERVQEEESTRDEDLADLRRRFDERVVELAALEARRLVAAGYRPGQDD